MSPMLAAALRTVRYRSRDAVLGVLACWPLAFLASSVVAGGPTSVHGVLALPTLLLVVGLVVGFVRHATRSFSVPRGQRSWWAAGLVVGALVVLPVYWWRFIWRAHR